MPAIAPKQIDYSWKDSIVEYETLDKNRLKNSSDYTNPFILMAALKMRKYC